MIIYAGPSLLLRLLQPRQAETFRDASEVQLVSTERALAECTADAVAAGVNRGMTPEGALACLAGLVDAQTGFVQIIDQDPVEVDRRVSSVAAHERIAEGHAWHLAAAEICFTDLAEPGEKCGFGADDGQQASLAKARGWSVC